MNINTKVEKSSKADRCLAMPQNKNTLVPFKSESFANPSEKYVSFLYALTVIKPSTTELNFVLIGPFEIESSLCASFCTIIHLFLMKYTATKFAIKVKAIHGTLMMIII